jgi:outer membrane lipoprotein carrier protein
LAALLGVVSAFPAAAAGKASDAPSGGGSTGAAKTGVAKTGVAETAVAKTGAAKTGAANTATTKTGSAKTGNPPPAGKGGATGHAGGVLPSTTSPASAPVDPTVAVVVAKVQARYDGARDFTASFEQSLTNAATQRASRSAGKVTFKKGGKMRWDYASPEPRMVLADGSRLWLWEPEDRQAFRQELASSQLPAALAFLTGRGKLTDEFRVAPLAGSPYGKPGQQVLSLEPKKPSAQVQRLVFVVDPASGFVHETVVFDAQGNANDLVFNDIKVNTGVADSFFAWTPPAGTRVIDPSAAH